MEPATWVILTSAIFALFVWLAARGGPSAPLLPRWDDRPTLPPAEAGALAPAPAPDPTSDPDAPLVVVGPREITGAPFVFVKKHRRPPFVLAHGFGGFRSLGVGPITQH